ncbi:MAG TPA: Uma2 family endonuclease [Tepidisphaeraceae bacterium]|nr:Uma2 family endonuclease [Tepidisphaeraceae bacterium]
MVANTPNLVDRFVPPPEPLLSGRWRLFRFTRSDAEELVRLGRIPEDASTELLNGMIVLTDRSARDQDPTMVGPDHRKCVEKLSSLRKSIDNEGRHVESQQPLVCSETHVPQPDFMILRGTLDQYQDLPTAADAFCVVEVADSSYERDAGEKLEAYARAGIAQYVIVNLRNRTAEVYVNPNVASGTYSPATIIDAGGTLSLRGGESEALDFLMAAVLP